jgi:hypothetical protein
MVTWAHACLLSLILSVIATPRAQQGIQGVMQDGSKLDTPGVIENMIGFGHWLEAPEVACHGGVEYTFTHWSAPQHAVLPTPPDLGSATVKVHVLDVDSSITAVYTQTGFCSLYRINAGGGSFTDADGHMWIGDGMQQDWQGVLTRAPGGNSIDAWTYVQFNPTLTATQRAYLDVFRSERYTYVMPSVRVFCFLVFAQSKKTTVPCWLCVGMLVCVCGGGGGCQPLPFLFPHHCNFPPPAAHSSTPTSSSTHPLAHPPARCKPRTPCRYVAAGNLVYNCIVNIPGVIAVDMMFMETWRSVVGSRLFNIKVQGSTVFTDVDIFNEAGYQTPLIKTSYVTLDTPGTITIEFVPRSGKEGPAVYGLELRVIGTVAPTSGAPSMPPTARPTHGFPLVTHRINCGGPSVTDTNGNVWVGDNAFAPGGDFVQPNKYVYLPLSQTTLGTPTSPAQTSEPAQPCPQL